MYRPTVRYDDEFKSYVDELFHSTSLDRNQIMRLALFVLGHSKEGEKILNQYVTTSLPSPVWKVSDHGLWKAQTWVKQQEVGTSVEPRREGRHEGEKQQRTVYKNKTNSGEIKLFIK